MLSPSGWFTTIHARSKSFGRGGDHIPSKSRSFLRGNGYGIGGGSLRSKAGARRQQRFLTFRRRIGILLLCFHHRGLTITVMWQHAGAPSVGETGRRKWRIDVSSESTRLSIPQGMQAFRVSVEDSILMEKTRDVLKSLETRFIFQIFALTAGAS